MWELWVGLVGLFVGLCSLLVYALRRLARDPELTLRPFRENHERPGRHRAPVTWLGQPRDSDDHDRVVEALWLALGSAGLVIGVMMFLG